MPEKRASLRRKSAGRRFPRVTTCWAFGHLRYRLPETAIGAHVIGRNVGTIGICLIGGHGASAHDRFADHFTPAQAQALIALIAAIERRTAIARITGHNQYAVKACPGFHVTSWLAATRRS